MRLRDGLLGAAIGWHLLKQGVQFWHAHSVKGTEMDFIPIVPDGHLLVECKTLSVSLPTKQLVRNLRDAVRQLDEHAALLETDGWKLRGAACVVNLPANRLISLQGDKRTAKVSANCLITYEQFPAWLKAKRRTF